VFNTDREFYKWLSEGEFGIQIKDVIILTVGVILLVSMLPSALGQFYAVGTANWSTGGCAPGTSACAGSNDTATQSLWRLIPLMGVLAAFSLIAIPVISKL
jgi:hypothetical protein